MKKLLFLIIIFLLLFFSGCSIKEEDIKGTWDPGVMDSSYDAYTNWTVIFDGSGGGTEIYNSSNTGTFTYSLNGNKINITDSTTLANLEYVCSISGNTMTWKLNVLGFKITIYEFTKQ